MITIINQKFIFLLFIIYFKNLYLNFRKKVTLRFNNLISEWKALR